MPPEKTVYGLVLDEAISTDLYEIWRYSHDLDDLCRPAGEFIPLPEGQEPAQLVAARFGDPRPGMVRCSSAYSGPYWFCVFREAVYFAEDYDAQCPVSGSAREAVPLLAEYLAGGPATILVTLIPNRVYNLPGYEDSAVTGRRVIVRLPYSNEPESTFSGTWTEVRLDTVGAKEKRQDYIRRKNKREAEAQNREKAAEERYRAARDLTDTLRRQLAQGIRDAVAERHGVPGGMLGYQVGVDELAEAVACHQKFYGKAAYRKLRAYAPLLATDPADDKFCNQSIRAWLAAERKLPTKTARRPKKAAVAV